MQNTFLGFLSRCPREETEENRKWFLLVLKSCRTPGTKQAEIAILLPGKKMGNSGNNLLAVMAKNIDVIAM